MINRSYWMRLIADALKRRSIVWLRGVRRAGKTYLCKSFHDIKYFDCEMPDIRRQVEDESFLREHNGMFLALDEVHRLQNPSALLKIAADHFPKTKIIATGSSLLETIKKFSDTLTGRKSTIYLTPAIAGETLDFGVTDTKTRMLKGGLPPFLVQEPRQKSDYNEWLDSFWARDITGLFKLEKRDSFMKMMELIFNESGGMFDAKRFGAFCGISRITVKNYLSVFEVTGVASVIRPFSGRNTNEIVSMPKIYGFDTGFICFVKGWDPLRQDDYGILWEHLVLNEITAALQGEKVHYWRDKQGHEIDFVIKGQRSAAHAIECKWNSTAFNPANLKIFRKHHPAGENYVVSHDITKPYVSEKQGMKIHFVNIGDIIGLRAGNLI
jgi:hypothetical protein